MSNPTVSVVIPTRNRRPLLEEAVESVRRQTFGSWELVVVDDVSEDDTWRWLTTQKDERMRALRLAAHRERSAARNEGLARARGDYILFLDDDDLLRPRALAALVGALSSNQEAIAAVGAKRYVSEHGRRRTPHPWWRVTRSLWAEVLTWIWGPMQGQVLWRRSTVLSGGGWREDIVYVEDQELWLRMSLVGPVVVIPEMVFEYRVHPGHGRWPPGAREAEVEILEEHLAALDNRQAARGRKLLLARQWFREGSSAYQRGDYPTAVRSLLASIRAAPEVVRSPLTGPVLVGHLMRALAGAMVGPALAGAVRKVRRSWRRRLGRDPWWRPGGA